MTAENSAMILERLLVSEPLVCFGLCILVQDLFLRSVFCFRRIFQSWDVYAWTARVVHICTVRANDRQFESPNPRFFTPGCSKGTKKLIVGQKGLHANFGSFHVPACSCLGCNAVNKVQELICTVRINYCTFTVISSNFQTSD